MYRGLLVLFHTIRREPDAALGYGSIGVFPHNIRRSPHGADAARRTNSRRTPLRLTRGVHAGLLCEGLLYHIGGFARPNL
ncbi:hypothetical protein J6590_029775 [Homalodisca vitripennis]|nr:hypothetical protein J6590_029775 [Homalodisca vitripennis]